MIRGAIDKGIQLIQLPCPEFRLYGSRRWGHVKDQFMHPHFTRESASMLEPVIDQLEEYMSYPEDFMVVGIVSVEGSPSCGWRLTCRGDWKGELTCAPTGGASVAPVLMEQGPGVFMEILDIELKKRNLDIPVLSMEDAIGIIESIV